MNIKINPELKSLIPPLSEDERSQLEKNLLEHGCRDPLVVWDGVLLDGHNRYEICERHGLEFRTVEIELDSAEQARVWMRNNQMGRRNLSAAWRIDLQLANKEDLAKIGAAKKVESGKETGRGNKKVLSQNDKTFSEPKHNTQAEIAKAANTSTGMVGMAEVVRTQAPELWEKAKADEVTVSAAYNQLKNKQLHAKPHVANNSGNNEWYTPPEFIEAARSTMGGIDVDPASNEIAQKNVRAETYYTEQTNGLDHEWRGRVWMNPPYSTDLIGPFCEKMVTEFESGRLTQAVVLVNNATEARWFASLVSVASMVGFTKRRVRFLDRNGDQTGGPLQGQAVLYIGPNKNQFVQEFDGICWTAEVRNG